MAQPRLIDISPTVSERIGVWPGDVAFRRDISMSIEQGDNIGLSAVHTTVHLGAHADAPNHYQGSGKGIESRSLERYFGVCQVMRIDSGPGKRILIEDLTAALRAPRLLLYTGSFPNPDEWNENFCSLSPELVDHLAENGVQLVGIDTPSIDPQDDRELLSHQRVAAHDMAILEGLVLEGVKDGLYTLIALPLKWEGADAAPVRAALLDDQA